MTYRTTFGHHSFREPTPGFGDLGEPFPGTETGLGSGLYVMDFAFEEDPVGFGVLDLEWLADPRPPPTTWSLDLCRQYERIGTVTAGVFNGVTRRNAQGDFTLDVAPAGVIGGHYLQPDVGPGIRPFDPRDVDTIRLVGEGRILFSGIVGGDAGGLRIVADRTGERWKWTGVDDWWTLNGRVAFPTPATPPPWADTHDERTGVASSVIAEYIDANIGAGALPERQDPSIVVDDDVVGMSSMWSARLQTLDALVARIARDGGIEVLLERRFDGTLRIHLTGSRNLSNVIVLSDQGDLLQSEAAFQPTSATWTVTGGQGVGTARTFRTADTGGVGAARREQFSDFSSATSADEVQADATYKNQLAGASYSINTELTDVQARAAIRAGVRLGDVVSVMVKRRRYAVPIEAVQFSWSAARQVMKPILGTATPTFTRQLFDRIDRLDTLQLNSIA